MVAMPRAPQAAVAGMSTPSACPTNSNWTVEMAKIPADDRANVPRWAGWVSRRETVTSTSAGVRPSQE